MRRVEAGWTNNVLSLFDKYKVRREEINQIYSFKQIKLKAIFFKAREPKLCT